MDKSPDLPRIKCNFWNPYFWEKIAKSVSRLSQSISGNYETPALIRKGGQKYHTCRFAKRSDLPHGLHQFFISVQPHYRQLRQEKKISHFLGYLGLKTHFKHFFFLWFSKNKLIFSPVATVCDGAEHWWKTDGVHWENYYIRVFRWVIYHNSILCCVDCLLFSEFICRYKCI